MGVRCFLVERCNERTVHATGDGWERDEQHFDIRRVDTGEIISTDREWMGQGGLPEGAMWFSPWRQSSNPPKSPDDWSGFDEDSIEANRRHVREHPELYPPGKLGSDPTLPKRSPSYLFADGPQLQVVCPGGNVWNIDSRASNCTMPYDYEHRCWVRHGEAPDITVDKNGPTCAAGAGSIQAGSYHGFLRNGEFTDG